MKASKASRSRRFRKPRSDDRRLWDGFLRVMLLWVAGQKYSGRELREMLKQVGFKRIEVKPTFGYWSVVTGVKP